MSEASAIELRAASAGSLLAPIVSAELWRLSEDELEASLEQVLAARAAADAATAVLLVEAEGRGLRSRTGAPTTQRWLTQRMRVSRPRAEKLVRQAEVVAGEPALLDALGDGRCSFEQAVVIGQVLGGLPPVDDATRSQAAALLVEQCASLEPAALARAGRHLHEQLVAAPDGDDPGERARVEVEAQQRAEDAQRARFLRWRRHLDGSISGRFRLDPAGGQTLLSAITALSTRPEVRPGEPAAGGVEGVPLDPAAAAGLTEPATADPRTLLQRRADALVSLAERAARAGELPDCAGTATTLVVTTTLDGLQGRTAAAGLLPYGGTLDPATLRRLACDAQVVPVVLGGQSQLLDLGRSRRLFTPAQRRAITLRDRGCIHPGCAAAPIDCDAHHALPWYEGGSSDLDNGFLLCGYDHQRHHREGWTIGRDTNGNPYVTPPATIDPQQRPRQHIRYQTSQLRT